jgi:hypothetical protein
MCVDCVLASPRIAQVDPGIESLPEVVLSHVNEFMEGLKTGKPIGKVSPLFLLMPQSIDTLH